MSSAITPTKVSTTSVVSPKTRENICVVCGAHVAKCENRRRLFKDGKKTPSCEEIEFAVGASLDPFLHTHVSCRSCSNRASTLLKHLQQFRQQFKSTRSTIGTKEEVVKRLVPCENQRPSKRVLFDATNTKYSADLQTPSTGCETVDMVDGDVLVMIKYATSGTRTYKPQHNIKNLVKKMVTTSAENAAKDLLSGCQLTDAIMKQLCCKINSELAGLCSLTNPSLLRYAGVDSLRDFSWANLLKELQDRTPLFLMILEAATKNPSQNRNKLKKGESLVPKVMSAAAHVISIYNDDLNTVRRLNSVMMKKGGLKKVAIEQLAAQYVCVGYGCTSSMLEYFGRTRWNIGQGEKER
ncbi:uncharacterized protein [Ptychodera flava]|uniref:uncharacterized protein n=1 Tax=Ptychodera flava TaxID=63121 RepID=UPI00396A0B6B